MSSFEVLLRTSEGRRRLTIDDAFVSTLRVEDRGENRETTTLFLASTLALLADSPLGPNKPYSLYKRYINSVRKEGVKNAVIRFTSLAHSLVSSIEHEHGHTSIGGFLTEFRDTPIFREYHEFYKSGNVALLRWIYTFLTFGKKMCYIDPTFNEVSFRDWCHNEQRLADHVLPEDVTNNIRVILSVLLPPFSVRDFRPKFGPGSVAERGIRGRIQKIGNLRYDALIDRFLFHGHFGKWGYGGDVGLTPDQVLPDPSAWTPAKGTSSRVSLLTFVPKNVKTSRSICMEPNTLMFFQQGILAEMTRLLRESKMGDFIHLQDQSFNRELSRIGSSTNLIDTIDLSSASDCLTYELVKRIFPSSWQIPMRATRSTHVRLPDGTVIRPVKFAPMGSALCFPTQCITFCACSILAACLYTYDNSGSKVPFSSWLSPSRIKEVAAQFWQHTSTTKVGFQPLGIYGDDICIDARLTDRLKSILTSLGFLVNVSKSFTGKQAFRESCGGFYVRGHDITPLYYNIKGVREVTTPEHVASQVCLINAAWERGYKNLYRLLRTLIMTWGRKGSQSFNPIPHVADAKTFGIRSNNTSNNHLKKRYRKRYQRDEHLAWTIVYTQEDDRGDVLLTQTYEHMRWWAGRHKAGTSPDDFKSSVPLYDTSRPGLRRRWMPVE